MARANGIPLSHHRLCKVDIHKTIIRNKGARGGSQAIRENWKAQGMMLATKATYKPVL